MSRNRKYPTPPKERLKRIWTNIKTRCYNSNNPNYVRYGAKGISMCDEWKNSYHAFKEWSLCNGYNDTLSIDRIDVYGDYEPNNCRWSTAKEQGRNKRNTRYITHNGETHCLSEWGEVLGMDYRKIWTRIHDGFSVQDALRTDNLQKKKVECVELQKVFNSITEARRELGMKCSHISDCCRNKRSKCGGYTWRYVNE